MAKQIINWIFILFSTISVLNGQSNNNISNNLSEDSVKFKIIQNNLDGCWKNKYSLFKYTSQFKYTKETNWGYEFKSRTHSSAPIFSLKIKNNEIYFVWTELLGGEIYIKIINIKKNRIFVENEDGIKFVYKRNKNCS